jgi:hypothetical protein
MAKRVIAHVQLFVVADDRVQLGEVLNSVQAMDRTHVSTWTEYHYDGPRKPRGQKQREALLVVTDKLARAQAND